MTVNSTIMIVDDMRLNIDLLAECLGGDYLIMPATSGESALRILERKKPDLILLDLLMPGIDGFEVLEYIKSREELEKIPVIFVTGEHDTQLEAHGLALGAVDYIRKPFNPTIVSTKVKNHLELKAYRDDLEKLVAQRTEELNENAKQLASMRDAIILGMSLVSENRDSVTGEHTLRMKKYTEILTRKLRELYPDIITPEAAKQTALFAPLHDVGKSGVPDMILNKPGSLTVEEFEMMKKHTLEGAELLKKTEEFLSGKTEELDIAIDIAEFHHEKFDGSGYPLGLKGEEIPISARVVAIADVYDAIRSVRPYKKAYSHEEAIEIITNGDAKTKRSHFDPRIMEAFLAAADELKQV